MTEASTMGTEALECFAKIVVFSTFILITIGGLVTSHYAGMAVPDWPLSFGSFNPEGWWDQLPVRLEHGHRLFAMGVGLLVGILCAWIWESWRALFIAAVISGVVPPLAATFGASKVVITHMRIWPAAIAFLATILILSRGRNFLRSRTVRGFAIAAFIAVCIQAIFGGLRVTQETAGDVSSATALRIVHGVFAQTFLCINVVLAVMLSAGWKTPTIVPNLKSAIGLRRLAWFAFGAIYLQLIVGAAMRHMHAGLAIPTFPQASPDGSWLPHVHNVFVDLNFTHTRVGAVLVTLLIVATAVYAIRCFKGVSSIVRPAWAALSLVFVQVALGIFVIWHTKPKTLTTIHVVNGAILLAVSLLLALRASKAAQHNRDLKPATSL